MYRRLTLQKRIFLISSLLILLAFAMIWVFVRPEYREAIINERTTIVSQLQEYSLKRSDQTIRNWLNATNYLAEEIVKSPAETQRLTARTINLTPGLMRITISETGSSETVDIKRSVFDDIDFSGVIPHWQPARIDSRINISWIPDSLQRVDFFLTQRVLQIQDDVYALNMYFNSASLTRELLEIPLGGNYVANIVSDEGENIIPQRPFKFPPFLVGEATYSDQTTVELGGNEWFVMTSRFETSPYWHVIAVEDSFILQPVYDLVLFSAISGAVILLIMIVFSWYVSDRINRPVKRIIQDVEHMSELDFTHRIKPVNLPEFEIMQETLENIRLTLHRYQKLNVEKIILEEWKNRYMMTYSEDLIGILDEQKTFTFLNNNFMEFVESLDLNTEHVSLDSILSHEKVDPGKSSQTIHSPDPFTIEIDQAELSHQPSDEKVYFYDYQHISVVDEEGKEQGALVILHDKTEDRLLDMKRNDMINIIVHELKNPITGVLGLSKLLLESEYIDSEERQVLLKEVVASGERMDTLVNRFLDVQRLEAGQSALDYEKVDILGLVKEVVKVSQGITKEKKLNTNITREGKNFEVEGSKELVFDAIQNLVSNAVKYGDPGRTIKIDLTEKEEQVAVSVTDHGYGISMEDQKKVFDKFYRVKSNPKLAKEKGTGLGLAYVKEIVRRHHGELLLESNPEIGSRFTLMFPKVRKES